MGSRRRAREHALKVLYQLDVISGTVEDAIAAHWTIEPEDDASVREFAEQLVHRVAVSRDAIDESIGQASTNWRVARMGTVDRNILRLALAELAEGGSTPDAVIIDEALEIAREYGESQSVSFVNGVLEAARRKLRGGGGA